MKNRFIIFFASVVLLICTLAITVSAEVSTTSICTEHVFTDGKCAVCGYVCMHDFNSANECNLCGLECSHGSTLIKSVYYDETRHQLYTVCSSCGYEVKTAYQTHSYNGCVCACGDIEHTWQERYTDGDAHSHFYVVDCAVCGELSEETEISHGDPSLTFYHTYAQNTVMVHTVQKRCADCSAVVSTITEMHSMKNGVCSVCKFACTEHVYENGKCVNCGILCVHGSSHQAYRYYNDTQHEMYAECDYCNSYIGTLFYYNHSYNDCVCACGDIEHTWQERYTDGDAHSHFYVVDCAVCGELSEETEISHGDPSLTFYHTYAQNTVMVHTVQKRCADCSAVVSTTTEMHSMKNGVCTVCKFACTEHVYENGKCVNCETLCNHTWDIKRVNGDLLLPTDCVYCTSCDVIYGTYRNLSDNVNYFARPPFKSAWNEKLSGIQFDDVLRRPYERFTVSDYAYNSGASVTLVGGFQYPEYVGKLNYSSYVVMRVRVYNVTYAELDLYGSDYYDGVSRVPSTECAAYCNIHFVDLPQNEWVNVVIDLSKLTPKNPHVFPVGSDDTFSYFRAVLNCQFASADGFVDIDYFALCDSLTQVDRCISFAYGEFYSNYYTYEDYDFINQTNTHNFNGGTCSRCNFECPHTRGYNNVNKHDEYNCGYYKSCKYCGSTVGDVIDWSPHNFDGNVVSCTKSNCDYECFHDYKNGVCVACRWKCTHNYENGHIMCVNCGLYAQSPPMTNPDGFFKLFTAIYDAQVQTFFSLLNYDIWGLNIANFIVTLVMLAICVLIIKKVI